jgi:glycerol uptake facilitator-like aquaporin
VRESLIRRTVIDLKHSADPCVVGALIAGAGLLVALYITFEAPPIGMSMNPARSFVSAVPARDTGPILDLLHYTV